MTKMICETKQSIQSLTILSFNCWGIPIPFVVKDYKIRMTAICQALFSNNNYDVICLQEIWSKRDFDNFQREARAKLPYSHYFHSGVMGSGVCVFSKWPIVEALFHKWQVNGYIHKIFHGDWYGGKGIGLCRLDVNGCKVNVYTCHTHAEYNDETEYIAHQAVQAYDIAQFIRVSSEDVDLAILAADLNMEPQKLCYRIIKNYAQLEDSFECTDTEYSGTYDCPRNSYRKTKQMKIYPEGQRIDYILYKVGKNASIKCKSYCMPLEPRIPLQQISYSDHEAISATFELSKQKICGDCFDSLKDLSARKKALESSLKEGYHICSEAVKKLEEDISFCRMIKVIFSIFIVLAVFLIVAIKIIKLSPGISFLFFIFSFVCSMILLFTIYIWKTMELNGILCTLHSMRISLYNSK